MDEFNSLISVEHRAARVGVSARDAGYEARNLMYWLARAPVPEWRTLAEADIAEAKAALLLAISDLERVEAEFARRRALITEAAA